MVVGLGSHASKSQCLAQRGVRIGVVVFGIAMAGWLGSEEQLRQFSGGLAQGRSTDLTRAMPIPGALMRQEVSPVEAIAFLAAQAGNLGVDWVSSTVMEPTTTAGAASGLEAWQATLHLSGTYPAVKRWMHEATSRYANVVWTGARWVRPAAGPVTTAMPGAPSGDRLEVQLQMAWLRQASGSAAPASAGAGFSGP